MASHVNTECECGHEKRDHRLPLSGSSERAYGPCKVCLCNSYAKARASALTVTTKQGG